MGVPLGLRDLAQLSPNRSQDTTLDRIDGATPFGINIVCVNADQHFVVKEHVGEKLFKDHYNIDYFAPFRDGQLGFVAVGWVVGALAYNQLLS